MGLSLALGAFLAGLIISESEYSHQATSNVLPFREIFTSFFFVSIGMLLDVSFLFHHIPSILLYTLLTILLKAIIASSAAASLRFPQRTSILVGLSLFQVGEFAFILSKAGIENNLLSQETYQYFLSVSILTMAATPFIINASDQISHLLIRTPLPFRQRRKLVSKTRTHDIAHAEDHHYEDHIIIIGYGINGRNVAKAATKANIPYVIIELNPETVRTETMNGQPILYGDATGDIILRHVNVHKARVVVVAISDPAATKKIIVNIRSITQKAYVIIRTRFILEMDENFKLGADEVIPEEFETSIEIFTRVLNKYLVPHNEIEAFTRDIRADNYQMLRPVTNPGKKDKTIELDMPEIDIATLAVQQGSNSIVGKKIADSQIRKLYGITVLTIKRDSHFITEIHPDTQILQDDVLYVFGKPDAIANFSEKISI
jgi:CPA2 family monovalent cation:H+ antiporter-2